MTSRSSSRSDGEILSSDSESKANKSLSSRLNNHVNNHNRRRSRSRSPYRAPRGEKRRREDDSQKYHHRRRNVKYEVDRYSKNAEARHQNTNRTRSRSPYRHQSDKDDEKSKIENNQSVSQTNENKGEAHTKEMNAKNFDIQNVHHVNPEFKDNKDESPEIVSIEERRRRREAIKNKFRAQPTPLLVKALHLGVESNSNESSPRRSASPAISTPNVDQSNPQSEDEIGFTDDVDSDKASLPDDPSAADYDPTVDMEEERSRHDKRLFKEDDKSLNSADQQVIAKIGTQEFDMFAEHDDDDDMFAERSVQSKIEKPAQALAATMMDNWDDPEGYYITILGELIQNRYHITQNLGRGMFSSVVRALDKTTNQTVAIKIVRNNESMYKAGIKEIDILQDIATNDPDDKKHIIRLERYFDHKGHLCMVFENLSLNLREVLKKFGRDIGINIKAIRIYAQQLFLGLTLLKKCQYLHADIKPDNILVNEARNILKICDLGSASPITENITAPYLVSRFYRSPEIILGIPYDYGIDMWSIGCTLFELYTGKILFTGRNNNNMLRTIMECRGKFPHKLLRRGTLTYDYFDDLLNFRSMETDKTTGRTITKLIDIKSKPIRDLKSRILPKGKKLDDEERKEVDLFLDLLDHCLDLRPEKRITPSEALKHPFILRSKG